MSKEVKLMKIIELQNKLIEKNKAKSVEKDEFDKKIEELEALLSEKDETIKEKSSQIEEKEMQITESNKILEELTEPGNDESDVITQLENLIKE